MTDDNMLDLLAVRFAGHPAADLGWRELLRVRDAVDRMLSGEIDRRQLALDLPGDGTAAAARRPAARAASTSPARGLMHRLEARTKAWSESLLSLRSACAGRCRCVMRPCGAPAAPSPEASNSRSTE